MCDTTNSRESMMTIKEHQHPEAAPQALSRRSFIRGGVGLLTMGSLIGVDAFSSKALAATKTHFSRDGDFSLVLPQDTIVIQDGQWGDDIYPETYSNKRLRIEGVISWADGRNKTLREYAKSRIQDEVNSPEELQSQKWLNVSGFPGCRLAFKHLGKADITLLLIVKRGELFYNFMMTCRNPSLGVKEVDKVFASIKWRREFHHVSCETCGGRGALICGQCFGVGSYYGTRLEQGRYVRTFLYCGLCGSTGRLACHECSGEGEFLLPK